jgi:hypothetical protein
MVAREAGVTLSMVSKVVNGRAVSRKVIDAAVRLVAKVENGLDGPESSVAIDALVSEEPCR